MRCSSLFVKSPGRISDYSGLYMVVSDSEDSNLAKLHHHLQCGRSAFKYFRRIARPSPKALPRTAAALSEAHRSEVDHHHPLLRRLPFSAWASPP